MSETVTGPKWGGTKMGWDRNGHGTEVAGPKCPALVTFPSGASFDGQNTDLHSDGTSVNLTYSFISLPVNECPSVA